MQRWLLVAVLAASANITTLSMAQTGGVEPSESPPPETTMATEAPDAGAAGAGRSWLAQRTTTPTYTKPEPEGGSWRWAGAAVLLCALGAVAIWMRRRRPTSVGRRRPRQRPQIEVVGSAKVGPKAFAVITRVGDRTLLLGVTDHAVQRLAWLEEDDATVDDAENASPVAVVTPDASTAAARADTVLAPEMVSPKAGFSALLKSFLGNREAADEVSEGDDAAAVIAAQMEDVVETRASRNARLRDLMEEEDMPVEGQVAGLLRTQHRGSA